MSDETHLATTFVVQPSPRLLDGSVPKPYVGSLDEYQSLYYQSIADPDDFFGKKAIEHLDWHRPFSLVRNGNFHDGDIAWFHDGQLNAAYNCIDRHAEKTPNKVALLYEGDEPGVNRRVTYAQLLQETSRVANLLTHLGIKKGDAVAIYMPMVPEAVIAMLACARVGAIHSVVFAGFSATSLRDRMVDSHAKLLITANEGRRGGKSIPLKNIADDALVGVKGVQHVLVYKHTNTATNIVAGRDIWWHEAVPKQRPYSPPVNVSAEDPLFMLYTSGSTGKPKGLIHTTAGYLLMTLLTVKYVFNYHQGDIFGCMADVGWITGHSYVVYGPLALGGTTVIFESIPTFPDPGRYWDLVQRHKITHFYTAPTALRTLRRFGDEHVTKYDLSSLRVLGSVGEPINPEAWKWYYEVVGRSQCALVDTYWMTELGAVVLTPLPGVTPMKPGSATLPFFGCKFEILESTTGKVLSGNDVTGVLALAQPIPSIARTIYGDHQRFLDTYMRQYKGFFFTGDGAHRDKDGYYWIRGRVDDVINVSGHRIGTAEIESALVSHPACSEAAVIGVHDEITGQAIWAFCTLKADFKETEQEKQALVAAVRVAIGAIATPKKIIITPSLPKTRSGKIMRRVLRKIAEGVKDEQSMGMDLSTLADAAGLSDLIQKVNSKL